MLQDLSGWLEETAPAQDTWRSTTGTSGKLCVTQTLVPKPLTWSAGSCSVAWPCPSLRQLTLEKGSVPSGTESCCVWGMNPFSCPAPKDPPGTGPAPMLPVSPAHVRTQGGVLHTGGVLGMGEQGRDFAVLSVRTGGVMWLSRALNSCSRRRKAGCPFGLFSSSRRSICPY